MNPAPGRNNFFVAGGTVPPGSPSYVERSADRELYEALVSGEYCYVLNSRQMGKSSLAVRTVAKLTEAGVRTAFIDLTRIGGPNVTAEQWFAGLVAETGRVLGLRQEAVNFLREHKELGPAQRFLSFLQEIALPAAASSLVVMIDEIDAVRSLSFSTDELFAGIRQLHNGRALEPMLTKLTFCLLGAALPSDLIRDPRSTPFNVGRRIELRDFSVEEARPFAAALGSDGDRKLARVSYWTGGHPFLTQALCAELADSPTKGVDAHVRERYLNERAREADSNLADVGNRLLGRGDPSVGDGERADVLSLYSKLVKTGIQDDESNPSAARIKMSGVARLEGGQLTIRNRIYASVFGAPWIRENMPGQELRRQKKAFWLGVARATALSGVVIVTVGTLSCRNYQLANGMERQRNEARYESYVASMQTMAQKFREGNFSAIERTLVQFKDSPSRGWEWNFWDRIVNQGGARLMGQGPMVQNASAAPDGKLVAVTDADSLEIYDIEAMKRTAKIALAHSVGGPWTVAFYRDGRRVLIQDLCGNNMLAVDAVRGKIFAKRLRQYANLGNTIGMWWDSPNDGYTFVTLKDKKDPNRYQVSRLNLDTLETTPVYTLNSNQLWTTWFNKSGSRLACYTINNGPHVSLRRTDDLAEIRRIPAPARSVDLRFDPDGHTLIICDGKSITRSEVDTGKIVWSIPYASDTNFIELSPDGRRMLTSTATRRANEYDIGAKMPLLIREIPNAAAPIFADGGRRILAFGDDWRVVDDEHRTSTSEVHIQGAPFLCVQTTAVGQVMIMSEGRLSVLKANNPLDAPLNISAPSFGFLDTSGRFILNWKDRGVSFSDILGQREPFTAPAPATIIQTACGADPSGNLLAFVKSPSELSVFDTRTGKEVTTLTGVGGPDCVKFSADGSLFASGDLEGVVSIWRTRGWHRVALGKLGRNYANCLAFSDDGTKVAAGLAYGDCGILDIRSGVCLRLQGHSEGVNSVCWSHDGKRLASGSDDKTVRLWDTATGKEIGIVAEHEKGVMAVWFVNGDRTLCSLDMSGSLKLMQTSDRL